MDRQLHWLTCMLCLSVWLAACAATSTPSASTPSAAANKPSLVVSAPTNGAQFALGSEVAIQSTATDAKGVVRIELWVDGILYRVDVTPDAAGLPNVTVSQTWPAKEIGNHTLLVKAINRDTIASDPQVINISVSAQSATATPAPTRPPSTATPLPAPVATAGIACEPNAAFVSDVTIPDGTPVKPGDAISKVWRVRNTGTCAWDASYQLAFVEATQMSAVTAVAVAPTAQGATVDIAVPMTAPRTPGTYIGKWRMRAPSGTLFGQAVFVAIRVVDVNAPTPTRTPVPTATPGALVMEFTVNRSTIAYGDCATLKWDVDNALAVKLQPENKGMIGHDTRQVCPASTTTYTLQVFVSDNAEPIEKEIVLTVSTPKSNGTVILVANASFDLDAGAITTSGADFTWDVAKVLKPQSGATFAVIGRRTFTEVSQDECRKNTSYSNADLSGLNVSAGTLICFKTNGSHDGKLRIESSDGELTVKWVTW